MTEQLVPKNNEYYRLLYNDPAIIALKQGLNSKSINDTTLFSLINALRGGKNNELNFEYSSLNELLKKVGPFFEVMHQLKITDTKTTELIKSTFNTDYFYYEISNLTLAFNNYSETQSPVSDDDISALTEFYKKETSKNRILIFSDNLLQCSIAGYSVTQSIDLISGIYDQSPDINGERALSYSNVFLESIAALKPDFSSFKKLAEQLTKLYLSGTNGIEYLTNHLDKFCMQHGIALNDIIKYISAYADDPKSLKAVIRSLNNGEILDNYFFPRQSILGLLDNPPTNKFTFSQLPYKVLADFSTGIHELHNLTKYRTTLAQPRGIGYWIHDGITWINLGGKTHYLQQLESEALDLKDLFLDYGALWVGNIVYRQDFTDISDAKYYDQYIIHQDENGFLFIPKQLYAFANLKQGFASRVVDKFFTLIPTLNEIIQTKEIQKYFNKHGKKLATCIISSSGITEFDFQPNDEKYYIQALKEFLENYPWTELENQTNIDVDLIEKQAIELLSSFREKIGQDKLQFSSI